MDHDERAALREEIEDLRDRLSIHEREGATRGLEEVAAELQLVDLDDLDALEPTRPVDPDAAAEEAELLAALRRYLRRGGPAGRVRAVVDELAP